MAVVHDLPEERSRLERLLTTDFCPWANRFVYWLKEPVGWFILATVVSVVIGLYAAPIGWTLAASLSAVIAVGMVWPWVAVRAVVCSLSAEVDQVHEDDSCYLSLSIRNRLPLPIWGLAVEGYLDRTSEPSDQPERPTVALAYVRGLSICRYRFSIRPRLRGRYPDGDAVLACSFPFGIWTARRTLKEISRVTVWPKVYPISGQNSMLGRHQADSGEGNRSGRTGDFIGVREYRRGDCVRQVNWLATAKSGALIVNERSGPQCPSLTVHVDPFSGASREEIADRMRVAASVLANLHRSKTRLEIHVGLKRFVPRVGQKGFVQIMDALADVPIDGQISAGDRSVMSDVPMISINSDDGGNPVVTMTDPMINHRLSAEHQSRVIDRKADLGSQLLTLWREERDANLVA